MSIFDRLTRASHPLSSADTGAVLAERQAYAEREAATATAAHDAYRAALDDAALAGAALDTPAVERAAREYERAQQRAQRAQEAVAAAQAQHDAAVAREAAAATKAYWDELERLAAAHTAAGREATKILTTLAAAAKKYRATSVELFQALPNGLKGSPHFSAFDPSDAIQRFTLEFERIVKDWPLASAGVPAPLPLAEIGAQMEAMLRVVQDEPAQDAQQSDAEQSSEDGA